MSMKWFSKKAGAIGIGALMGGSATFLAMVPSSKGLIREYVTKKDKDTELA